jgi:hypothetical protein
MNRGDGTKGAHNGLIEDRVTGTGTGVNLASRVFADLKKWYIKVCFLKFSPWISNLPSLQS